MYARYRAHNPLSCKKGLCPVIVYIRWIISSAGEHSNDGSLMLHSPTSWPLSDDSGAYKKAAPYMTASLGQTLIDFIETKTFRTIFYHTKFKCFFP